MEVSASRALLEELARSAHCKIRSKKRTGPDARTVYLADSAERQCSFSSIFASIYVSYGPTSSSLALAPASERAPVRHWQAFCTACLGSRGSGQAVRCSFFAVRRGERVHLGEQEKRTCCCLLMLVTEIGNEAGSRHKNTEEQQDQQVSTRGLRCILGLWFFSVILCLYSHWKSQMSISYRGRTRSSGVMS